MHICSCHGIPGVLLSCGRGLPHGVQDLRWFETVLTTAMKETYEYIYITHSSLIVLFHVLIVLYYVLFCVDCVVHVLFVRKGVLLPPGVNPIAVKYIISLLCS